MSSIVFLWALIRCIQVVICDGSSMPLPWTDELTLGSENSGVYIACSLLQRDGAVEKYSCDQKFDDKDASATSAFQSSHGLVVSGVLDAAAASLLLQLHSADGYKDDGFTAESMGYKYKIHIQLYSNRSIETRATLFDAKNTELMTFPVRGHGWREDDISYPWPDFGNGDIGLNEFTSNGNTPTGLIEIDLNSPEPNPQVYGPWPITRFVHGLKGNAQIMLPNIRDGVLIHTGNWTTADQQWTPSEAMPNSAGCVHSHPTSVRDIYRVLSKLGVVVNDNPFSGKNYPFGPQGIASVELIA
jgi:peptidoglycan hydrolase-like protein with peptidoglycan-binding domain